MKVRNLIKLIEKDGWYLDRTRGSHRQFRHSTKPGIVTIAGKLGLEVPPRNVQQCSQASRSQRLTWRNLCNT